jgi:hypothetical protein
MDNDIVKLSEELGDGLANIKDSFNATCKALGGEVSGGVSFSQGVDIATGDIVINANFNGACKVPSSGMGLQ